MDASQKERATKAFHLLEKLELVLLDEKEMPTRSPPVPRTYDEWMKRKSEVKAKRQQNKGNSVKHR
jgi:hypothetical protein